MRNIEIGSGPFLQKNLPFSLTSDDIKDKVDSITSDSCPSCDSDWINGKCKNCGYGLGEEYFEQNKLEAYENLDVEKITTNGESKKKLGKKIEFDIGGQKIIYHHTIDSIRKDGADIKFSYLGKIYKMKISFKIGERAGIKGVSEDYKYIYDIALEKPKNFDGKHKIVNCKSNRGVFFDFNFALKIAKNILFDSRFNNYI